MTSDDKADIETTGNNIIELTQAIRKTGCTGLCGAHMEAAEIRDNLIDNGQIGALLDATFAALVPGTHAPVIGEQICST